MALSVVSVGSASERKGCWWAVIGPSFVTARRYLPGFTPVLLPREPDVRLVSPRTGLLGDPAPRSSCRAARALVPPRQTVRRDPRRPRSAGLERAPRLGGSAGRICRPWRSAPNAE